MLFQSFSRISFPYANVLSNSPSIIIHLSYIPIQLEKPSASPLPFSVTVVNIQTYKKGAAPKRRRARGIGSYVCSAAAAAAAAVVIAAAAVVSASAAAAAAAQNDDQHDDPQTTAAAKPVITAPHMSTSHKEVLRRL